MPTAWLSPGMTRGLSPNLWKRASSAFRNGRMWMTPLCAAVSASYSPRSTSIPLKVAPSAKRVDQLVHVHCLEERMIRPLLSFTIVTALVCLVPSVGLPVARTPAARFPVARTPPVTKFTLAPSVRPLVVVVVFVPAMNPSVAIVITVPDIGPLVMIVIPIP